MSIYPTPPSAAALALPGQGETSILCYILDAILGVTGGTNVPTPTNAAPATIAAGVTYDTGAIAAAGFGQFAASAKLSQTGSMVLQRYIDVAGTVPIGDAITQAMTANFLATVAVNDGLPCASWNITIQNTSVSVANLTLFNLLEKK